MTDQRSNDPAARRLGRRGFLGLAVGGAVGAAAAVTIPTMQELGAEGEASAPPSAPEFRGRHQAGISTPQQGTAMLVSFTLGQDTDRAAIGRLLRTWTESIEALMDGRPVPGDTTPVLAAPNTALTVTVGVGARTIARCGADSIDLRIPPFAIDRLDPQWSGGDVVLQVCANDSTTVQHAARMLQRDAQPFALPRWRQSGFNGQRPAGPARNLMGFIEGTANPAPSAPVFDDAVWADEGPAWFNGGTTMVVRRIRMGLDAWDRVGDDDRDKVIGRRIADGAPRGKASSTDGVDFDLLDVEPSTTHVHDDGSHHEHTNAPVGLAVPEDAHVRRAHPSFNDGRVLFRRGYSYSDGLTDEGLVFISFQRELDAYVGIQRSLAERDALNRWTTPVGSAAFAVLPGVEAGDWLGRRLVEG
jgi:dye decolorizing peroxidase